MPVTMEQAILVLTLLMLKLARSVANCVAPATLAAQKNKKFSGIQ
jgi:hypothetical protein